MPAHQFPAQFPPSRRAPVLLAILTLHVLTLLWWQGVRHPKRPPPQGEHMQWVWVLPRVSEPPPAKAPSAKPVPAPTPSRPAARVSQAITLPPPVRAPVPDSAPTAPAPELFDQAPAEPLEPGRDLLAEARSAAGKVDQQLRMEAPRRPERLKERTDQQRFVAGIERAAVRNNWGPADIQEIASGNPTIRLYKVTGLAGTYCMRYDLIAGTPPKILSCPN